MQRSPVVLPLVLLALFAGPVLAADAVFDPARLHETHLAMDPADWRALQANYRLDDYYAADVTIDGVRLAQVGVRSRGGGSRNEVKPALKVDFNRYVAGQTLRGLKSLSLKNLVQDPAMVRERLSMAVFEAMGIAAPAISFTRLYVNGEDWGVYNLVESVDKTFLQARLGEDGGNLYSYEWTPPGYDFGWRGPEASHYVPLPFEPETNEKDHDPSALLAFLRAVNEAPDEAFTAEMRRFLDVERFLAYVAVENVLQDSDGFVGREGTNNLYLYQHKGTTRFTVVPWDKNTTLQSDHWPLLTRLETNVLTRRLLRDPALQRVYVEAAARAARDFVNPRWLGPLLEQSYGQIREAALADTKKPFSNDVFETGIVGLRGVIVEREADVLAEAGALLGR